MTVSVTTLEVTAVLFLATFVRATLGFGEALMAVPLLALLIPIQVAAPVAVLISISVAAAILVQDWRHVHVPSASWLIVSTLIGTPLGLLLLTRVPGHSVKACLGLVIAAFSLYGLLRRELVVLKDDRLAWAFGFSAGVLGGAYGMNGPPLVVYGALRGWSAPRFRATLQGYFLIASMMAMAGYWLSGLWTADVTHYYLASLPAVVIAMLLGRLAISRMNARVFMRWVNVALIAVALLLIAESV
ncbi:MAG TPA: sulfite exporter TauE/SafE family protein [Steroidobacteraceae bacterium]|nr:sulfite exporter TauE/SafE family protein [Steroidobacteraceae bacterium]